MVRRTINLCGKGRRRLVGRREVGPLGLSPTNYHELGTVRLSPPSVPCRLINNLPINASAVVAGGRNANSSWNRVRPRVVSASVSSDGK